jgi:hypothetical protein
MSVARKTTLRLALRAAAAGHLDDVWLYLPQRDGLSPNTACLLVAESDENLEATATSMGFPIEGLDTQTLEGTAECARGFHNPPSDALLLESFIYYLKFDAWLPQPGAPDPPPWQETQRLLDREFYVALGQERATVPCRKSGCSRGAIEQGVLCRSHHFEMLMHEPCPFTD